MKTLKQLSALFIFGLFTNTLYAQSLNVSGGFTSSIFKHAGSEEYSYTFNSADGTESTSAKMKRLPGYNAGISFEFKINQTFSLEPGLRFQTRGFQFHEIGNGVSGGSELYSYTSDFTYQENYFDIPVVLNVGANFGDFRVYGRAGLYGGLLSSVYMRQQTKLSAATGESINSDESLLLKSDGLDARFTAGFLFGTGINYKGFYLEANHLNGLVKSDEAGRKSNDFSINVGYKFQLGR